MQNQHISLKEQLRRKLCPCNFLFSNQLAEICVGDSLINLFLIESYPSWRNDIEISKPLF